MNDEIEILKEALRWYMEMYGCNHQMNKYDDDIEYSCNGYVVNRKDMEAITKAERIVNS